MIAFVSAWRCRNIEWPEKSVGVRERIERAKLILILLFGLESLFIYMLIRSKGTIQLHFLVLNSINPARKLLTR